MTDICKKDEPLESPKGAESLKKNDYIELDITDINNLGNGVGRMPDGRVVFVRGAVSKDRILARIIKVNSDFAVGRLEKVLLPSEYRCDKEFCTAPMSCGGCVYRHISYKHELELKRQHVKHAFEKVGLDGVRVLPVYSVGKEHGYRNKAQFPVAVQNGRVVAGFYASKTHKVIPISACAIQNEAFGEIVGFVCDYATKQGWSVYDEASGHGLLRHIYLRIGEASGEIMLCLVCNGKRLPQESDFVNACRKRFPNISSILLNLNTKSTNVVLGEEYRVLYGKRGIEDRLCDIEFFISPESFYQVNREGAQLLYNTAAEMAELSGSELLLDLYCGTGTIGLTMARRVSRLCGIEIVRGAVDCAVENAKRNSIENASFFCADAGSADSILHATNGSRPDVVILDPPRKGSTRQTVERIAQLDVPKVIYISCDPTTLARDAVWFEELGYSIGDVRPVDMFPKTGHVECVVLMSKGMG